MFGGHKLDNLGLNHNICDSVLCTKAHAYIYFQAGESGNNVILILFAFVNNTPSLVSYS